MINFLLTSASYKDYPQFNMVGLVKNVRIIFQCSNEQLQLPHLWITITGTLKLMGRVKDMKTKVEVSFLLKVFKEMVYW